MGQTKRERMEEFFRRLAAAPAAASREEALLQLTDILNAVEDECTDIPYDPARWQSDGRLYPPQADAVRDVPDFPNVKRFRSLGHNTFIAINGAIEIRTLSDAPVLSKPGADGQGAFA